MKNNRIFYRKIKFEINTGNGLNLGVFNTVGLSTEPPRVTIWGFFL